MEGSCGFAFGSSCGTTSLGFLSRALPVAGMLKNMAAGCLVVWLGAPACCSLQSLRRVWRITEECKYVELAQQTHR
jgi:hypothetical protein